MHSFNAIDSHTTIETDIYDDVFLLSEVEIFGTTTYSASGEGSQYPYFETTTNRYKKPTYNTNNSARWWERSPRVSFTYSFCFVSNNGNASNDDASDSLGLAPAFCL